MTAEQAKKREMSTAKVDDAAITGDERTVVRMERTEHDYHL